ncbi:hypothetical protein AAFC00_002403 [Neodothiora populina]|uniref:Acetyl-CoA synthetase-like protein n=1 Tax=Neodothiora populina TaxID=2781224 RepID=A0ABR3P747_9PEZI
MSPIAPCYKDLVTFVLEHDDYHPDKEVLIDALNPLQSITLNQARRYVRKLVGGLRRHTITRGDTICVHAFNSVKYPLIFLGIIGAGGRFTGSNPSYTATELAHHFRISQTRVVITCQAQLETVRVAAQMSNVPPANIIVLDEPSTCTAHGATSMHALMDGRGEDWQRFDDYDTASSTAAALLSTSGTTGLPKMAIRSHLSWVAENQAIEDELEKPYEARRLLCVPFFHAFAAPLALISALRSGHPTYVMTRFKQQDFLAAIARFKITETAMPPPLIVRFLAMQPDERAMLKSIELVWCGGAPLSEATQNSALQMLAGSARICQVYGMTEGGWMTTFLYPEGDRTGSVGRPIGNYEVKIKHSDSDCVVSQHVVGEVLFRGSCTMSGYLNNVKATQEAFDQDGWLRTGDVGYINDAGKLYILDRKKELIKVRGWQVAPAELESCYMMHKDIVDAAVIGVSHPIDATEVPRAYLVRVSESSVSEREILSFASQYLAKYKIMDCQIRFCDSIPKSASGKILKKVLRETGSDSGYESAGGIGIEV